MSGVRPELAASANGVRAPTEASPPCVQSAEQERLHTTLLREIILLTYQEPMGERALEEIRAKAVYAIHITSGPLARV